MERIRIPWFLSTGHVSTLDELRLQEEDHIHTLTHVYINAHIHTHYKRLYLHVDKHNTINIHTPTMCRERERF